MELFTNKLLTKTLLVLLVVSAIFTSCKKDEGTKTTTSTPGVLKGTLTGTVNLSADTIYTLDGYVVVGDGATLNIAPGTIIKAKEGSGAAASALIVSKSGTINAIGTAAKPIVFTSIQDNIALGQKYGTNLTKDNAGLWGGVIVLGQAKISNGDGGATGQIEGIPGDQSFASFGGSNDAHSSGTLSYISIRHNGTELKPNEELQGLTLGGVGSGTVINNIEVVASSDDGIEIFGGSVNLTDIVIVYHGDDGLDLDQSYSGTINNAYIIHEGASAGNAGFEFDGPEKDGVNDAGMFTVTNVTVKTVNGATGRAATLKSAAQGTISNCVFIGYSEWVNVEGGDAIANYVGGTLQITGCEFVNADLTGLINPVSASTSDSTTIVTDFNTNNTAVTTVTKGATTTGFGWTWASNAGLL